MRAPLVETQQHGSIRVADLTPVLMSRNRFRPPEERLIPFEASRNVSDADDCPCALHCASLVGHQAANVPNPFPVLSLKECHFAEPHRSVQHGRRRAPK